MKSTHFLWIAVLVLLFLLIRCRHKPEEPIISGHPCHPDTVYFERDVLPLLRSSCAFAGCHDAEWQQKGVILDSYANVMATADVRPGRPENSDLYEVLIEDDPSKRMPPPPLTALSSNQIEMIRKWILQGALNLTCDDE